jgi:hypothetical protein
MNTALSFNVQERDIDLLILEQVHISSPFVAWLAEKAGIVGASLKSARHSVSTDKGETDILLFLDTANGRIALMIEDKIGAPMQPRQCERYHERGRALCEEGKAKGYRTLLCAPATYLHAVPTEKDWHARLPLEEIADWFGQDLSPAATWRRAILTMAASKIVRAREADDKTNHTFDPDLVALKTAYRQFVEARYPELIAEVQPGRDREYYIKARELPAGIRFKHSFFRGEVSMILEKKWADIARAWLPTNSPNGTWIVEHVSELHLRSATEVMDPALPFEQQQETAVQALNIVDRFVVVATEISRLNRQAPGTLLSRISRPATP